MQVDGTGLKQVTTTQNVDEDRPSWSPNGKELAYGRNDDADPASGWDVYAIGVPSSQTAIVPTPTADPTPLTQQQFATTATASSEFTSYYGPAQATGAPYEERYGAAQICGDTTAWSPSTGGLDPEWLEAQFTLPVFATGVTVYEPYNSGFIYQVDLIDTDGNYHTVWTGTDSTSCPGKFALTFDRTDYKVRGVKIYTKGADYEEIDAVMLTGGAA